MTSASDEKWRNFNCFFQSWEHVLVRRGQIRRIEWVIKTMEAQVGQFLLRCKCPVSRCIVVQEQETLRELPVVFFLQNVLQLHQQRWVILLVDSFIRWRIINEEKAVFIPKNRIEARTFPEEFCTRKFWGGMSRYATTPLIVALSPGHSDITRFRSWSPIATGNRLDRAEKMRKFAQKPGKLTFLICVQAIRDPLHRELPFVPIFMIVGSNPLRWNPHLLSYWFSQKPVVFQD